MADRTYAVHVPALSLPEAAMLTALPRAEERPLPGNLVLRDHRTYYPMPDLERPEPVQPVRGSMAGRAVLRAVQWPSQKKKGRA